MDHNDRSITALVMVAHSLVHTYEMTVPIFVALWLSEFRVIDLGVATVPVTTASVGAVVTVGYALFGLGALPGGVLVDRVGSRRLITACLLGMGASYLLLGLAPGMVVVALALALWGIAASVYHPAGLALLSKGVRERGTGFAYHGIAGNLGIGLGPLVAAILLLVVEWRTVALVLGVPALFAAAYAAQARFDETAAVDAASADGGSKASSDVDSLAAFRTETRRLFGGRFLLVFAIVVCSGLYYRGVLTFMPELLGRLPVFEPVPVGRFVPAPVRDALGVSAPGRTLNPGDYFYSGLLVVGVVGQYVGGKLTDRVRVEYGLAVAFGVLAVLAVLFVPVTSLGLGPLLALGAVLGVVLFLVQPMYQATVAEYTPAGTRGLSYGFTYLGVFGVGALGGGIAGTILAVATPTALFGVLAGLALVASLLGLALGRRPE
ncbi:MFS transporter [Haloarculaceae archaeon H-GB11]|nr:MFS transporter [Haloarculaceae archaeon H-GB11]